ncbi:hypothetical protein ACFVAJ_17630 [Agromyces sp. NPDC057679]|uniref:hypothetical protein n=1 Tax=Agromyces sp. NPDC057679 TaxID=3346207 RepID=UPI00366BF067
MKQAEAREFEQHVFDETWLSSFDRGFEDGSEYRPYRGKPGDQDYANGYEIARLNDDYDAGRHSTERYAPPAPYSTETGDPSVFDTDPRVAIDAL